jgi:hypothetical protein
MVGTVPYLVPIPVSVGSTYDEQLPPDEEPAGLPAPSQVQPTLAPPPGAQPMPFEPQMQIPEPIGSADRTCAPVVQEDPVHFFIALKNHTVAVGVAYWIVDGTLHYLTLEGDHNQVSLDLIDRAVSAKLNEKGRVPLILPK